MPEGDSVLQLSNRLQWMTGRQVTHSDIRVPRFATEKLDGMTVRRVWPYGKHLFMQMDETIVHTHLKMEGVWAIHTRGTRWRRPAHTARIILRLTPQRPGSREIEVVGHSLGFVRLLPASSYDATIAYLGPDILSDQWLDGGRDEAVRRICSRPERSLGAALLDQKNVAGIGNEYRAEIMFLLGWDPVIEVGKVGRAGVERAVDLARRVMWENRLEPRRVFTGDRRPGQGTYVFGRAGRPCRRCGEAIMQSSLGGAEEGELERIIWWCPQCQRR